MNAGEDMAETRHVKVLIIGSGPAGYTAGVYASRAMLEPLLVQGIEPGGQLTTTTDVENWPGDTEVQGPDLMVRMEAHAKAMGCEMVSRHHHRLSTCPNAPSPPGRQRHDLYLRRRDPCHRCAGKMAGPAV